MQIIKDLVFFQFTTIPLDVFHFSMFSMDDECTIMKLTYGHVRKIIFNVLFFYKGLKLKFTLSPLLQPYHGKLFCNHPDKGKKFKRSTYQELKWQRSSKCKCDDGDRFAELETHIPGSFHFYFQYSEDDGK
jgi:hypothetical protein